ncbi:right-handed parallel beta-helix repeat-containing protein [Bacteroidota bacterium]
MKQSFLSILYILIICSVYHLQAQESVLLPDGTEYKSWEKSLKFSTTYFVDQNHSSASDNNPGTEQKPYKTIGKAAQVLQPGERVVIATGVYRELVRPLLGGDSPTKMISYEAAPGARVVVRGSRIVNKDEWGTSTGFNIRDDIAGIKIYQYDLEKLEFNGYNPFGISNIMWDRVYFPFSLMVDDREKFKPHAFRRGMIFIGERKLDQVEKYQHLAGKEDAFWVEHNGLTLHVHLQGNADPSEHEIEFVVQEQVFAPKKRHLGYIRIKGIVFEHGANGFPVPQRGIVSTNRGHHWIIEDCEIRHANAVGLDIGNETWNADEPPVVGYHIIRNCHIEDAGICGIAGIRAVHTLVEGNIIENIGWQDTERSWESAGIKFHQTQDNVFRNNIIRDVIYAPALWLDYDCANSRITNNLLCTNYQTNRGAIYLEASQHPNMIDHNIIWDIQSTDAENSSHVYHNGKSGGWGILIDGSDETIVAHNLFGLCQNSAVKTRSIETRIVTGRGGTSRWNKVINNIFYRCVRGIDFNTEHNYAEGNLYLKEGYEQGDILNRIYKPEQLLLDLPAWQKFYGFDKTGAYAEMVIDCDLEKMTMTLSVSGTVPELKTDTGFEHDFSGEQMGKNRLPGPFGGLPAKLQTISIDPRK